MSQPPAPRPTAQPKPANGSQPVIIMQVNNLITQNSKAIADALPKHLTPQRMARIALTEFRKSPQLQKCDPMSFLGAIVQASQLGLEPGSALGHCYLIPYGRECNLQLGYRGMIDIARRSGNISSISGRVVFDGDEFDYELGTNEFIKHRPRPGSNRAVTHVYAVAKLRDGGLQLDVMTADEVNEIRDKYSSSYKRDPKNSPWSTAYDEMAKKTVIRRLFKLLPTSIEIRDAIRIDEDEHQQNAKIIDPAYEVMPAVPEPERLAEAWAVAEPAMEMPAEKAANAVDKTIAIGELQKAVAGVRKVSGDPEKIMGRPINDILMGSAAEIGAAADALSLWEPGK